jgi:hypothetical protein
MARRELWKGFFHENLNFLLKLPELPSSLTYRPLLIFDDPSQPEQPYHCRMRINFGDNDFSGRGIPTGFGAQGLQFL